MATALPLNHQQGQAAEQLAADWLTHQGMRILMRNFRCKGGEIDLICQHKDTLVFVEVRLRKPGQHTSAGESITPTKQRRIIRTAEYFLLSHPQLQHCAMRFDVVLFEQLTAAPHWIPAAFDAY